MPIPAYAWLKVNGTDAEGGVQIAGREGAIEVLECNHVVRSPQTHEGRAAGKRVHEPLVLTKVFDRSSPMIYQALAQNATCELRIDWYRINDSGAEEVYFQHLIENARIVNVRAYMPHLMDQTRERYTHHEEVAFLYPRITWTHVDGAIEFQDDWFNPNV